MKYKYDPEAIEQRGAGRALYAAQQVERKAQEEIAALAMNRTRAELAVHNELIIAKAAIVGVAELTELIASLEPSDPETYALMLGIKATFQHAQQQRIIDCRRRNGA